MCVNRFFNMYAYSVVNTGFVPVNKHYLNRFLSHSCHLFESVSFSLYHFKRCIMVALCLSDTVPEF